ncbi:NAD(P)H-dependent oxidoreductase [Chachezhania antarctica]|uniref:NAD(P)H-dependent oxidoreductase n=1 Tax=Chachezhania antarctica TaxID=2340860 RepID=UPI000EAFBFE6|nr:NAD(P)H-dependent oxidoreductase [Chachezhania antarctica]|tara:strand:+ start:107 stop:733 length:627 start_codon:yes stop_codon:yes gene_type:complete
MQVLVVYCHPRPDSFTAAVKNTVLEKLHAADAAVTVLDLYAEGFDPVMGGPENAAYLDCTLGRSHVAAHVVAIEACDTLIFVYPTWWYGLPAMLKGWLDRVLLPGSAFLMPDETHSDIRPGLTHIKRLAVFTTCGASWWLTRIIGAPGKRTILRGLRILCAPRCRTAFAAHYLMDASSPTSRAKHLKRVARKMDRFLGGPGEPQKVPA